MIFALKEHTSLFQRDMYRPSKKKWWLSLGFRTRSKKLMKLTYGSQQKEKVILYLKENIIYEYEKVKLKSLFFNFNFLSVIRRYIISFWKYHFGEVHFERWISSNLSKIASSMRSLLSNWIPNTTPACNTRYEDGQLNVHFAPTVRCRAVFYRRLQVYVLCLIYGQNHIWFVIG